MRERLEQIHERIHQACRRCGRGKDEVSLLGASKKMAPEKIRETYEAGLTLFGENRIQEALPKIEVLSDLDITWHFIGRLQKNKAAKAIANFSLIQSVDSLSLARRLEQTAAQLESLVSVLLEVNIGGETTKAGLLPGEVEEACSRIMEYDHLTIKGLMAIPPYHLDPEKVRPYFRMMRDLYDSLAGKFSSFEVLSMGMSDDFEVAIEEGSTLIRVGRALFGERG